MKKKVISLVLTATMLFGASMTVFATEDTGNTPLALASEGEGEQGFTGEGTVTLDSDVVQALISVTVTAGSDVVANPYALNLSEEGYDYDLPTDETEYPTLLGSTLTFENTEGSNVAISVGLKGQIVIGSESDVAVASSESKIKSATTKQVYIQAKVYGDDACTKEFYKNGSSKAESALIYSAKGASMSNAPVLATKAQEEDADNYPNVSSTIYVEITGATSIDPSSEWTANDAFQVITTYDIGLSSASALSTFKTPEE